MNHINHHLPRTCPACVADFDAQAAARRVAYDVPPVTTDFDTLFDAIIGA